MDREGYLLIETKFPVPEHTTMLDSLATQLKYGPSGVQRE